MLLTACSFNKKLLFPAKIPLDMKTCKSFNPETGDTIILNIGKNYQPTYTNTKNDTIDPGYGIESVLFENKSGKRLNGYILSPDSGFNGTTILFLHGNGGNIVFHRSIIPLVKRGFRVFIFDYSGFGFSEGKATLNNTFTDADSALAYIVRRTDIKPEKLFIYGQSLGGYIALTVAANSQDKIDGLIVEGAFTSIKDLAAIKYGFLGRIFLAEKYNGSKSIKKYKKPLLIIHSSEDQVVPYKIGRKLFDQANEPKTFYETQKCHICGLLFYADSIAIKINEMTRKVSR